jgi:hypothetical protein
MKKLAIDKSVEDRREGQQAKADALEEIIILPEREPNSVVHIASPRLANPDQAKDFEKQIFTE